MNAAEPQTNATIQQIVQNFRLIDDDFMVAVFSNKDCAELLLRIVLERNDLTVKYVRSQYEIKNLTKRSVCLDIFAEDTDGKKYNVEIQRDDRNAISRRARYNASLIDASITFPSEQFKDIPEVYVIFITENDVLKGGLPLYHIDRIIRETSEAFNDGSHIIYVNSQIRDETALGKLMHDFYCKRAGDMKYPVLAAQVRHFKENKEGNAAMCRSVEKLANEQRRIGMQKGKENAVLENLRNLTETLNLTIEQAMDALKVAQDERPALLEKLAQ